MSDRQHRLSERLSQTAGKLRGFLSHVSTHEIVHRCHQLFRMTPREAQATAGLGSPAKQGLYLLGLTLSTPEPDDPQELTDKQWEIIFAHLRQASEAYAALFIPPDTTITRLDSEARRRYAVVAMAFLHYFHTAVLASGEQLLGRAQAYFSRFDADLERIVGLTSTKTIEMVEWTTDHLQQS